MNDSGCLPIWIDSFVPFGTELSSGHIQGNVVVGYTNKVSAKSRRPVRWALVNITVCSPKLLGSNCHLDRVYGGSAVNVQARFGRLLGWESRHRGSLCSFSLRCQTGAYLERQSGMVYGLVLPHETDINQSLGTSKEIRDLPFQGKLAMIGRL